MACSYTWNKQGGEGGKFNFIFFLKKTKPCQFPILLDVFSQAGSAYLALFSSIANFLTTIANTEQVSVACQMLHFLIMNYHANKDFILKLDILN